MMIAPNAEPDDGLFDIIIMRDTTIGDLLMNSGRLRDGTHLANPKVSHMRAKSLIATPLNDLPVFLDVDGEAPGRLPAQFDIIPGALTLRC